MFYIPSCFLGTFGMTLMRKIFLLTVLIMEFYLHSFSQVSNLLKIDSLMNFSLNKDLERFGPVDSSINWSSNSKNFHFPNFNDSIRTFIQNLAGDYYPAKTHDNMPVVKPKGKFFMPVYKPDSTINFMLQIKKYPRVID